MKNYLSVVCQLAGGEEIAEGFEISKVVTVDAEKKVLELRQLKDGRYQLTISKSMVKPV